MTLDFCKFKRTGSPFDQNTQNDILSEINS